MPSLKRQGRRRHTKSSASNAQYQPLKINTDCPFGVDGVTHHFISVGKVDGMPVGHSNECSGRNWLPYPCGCHYIKGSGGKSPRCDEMKRLEQVYDELRHSPHDIHPEDYDLLEAYRAKAKQAQYDVYRHTCICGAFDRPERRAVNVHPNGLLKDVPLAVLRSHPQFAGLLPEKWEGRWVSLNPAWQEMSVRCYVGQLRLPCTWSRKDSAPDHVERRDGLEALIVYIKPLDEIEWLKKQFMVELIKEADMLDLLIASIKRRLNEIIQARKSQVFGLVKNKLASLKRAK